LAAWKNGAISKAMAGVGSGWRIMRAASLDLFDCNYSDIVVNFTPPITVCTVLDQNNVVVDNEVPVMDIPLISS
jgi:hypothetical protein